MSCGSVDSESIVLERSLARTIHEPRDEKGALARQSNGFDLRRSMKMAFVRVMPFSEACLFVAGLMNDPVSLRVLVHSRVRVPEELK